MGINFSLMYNEQEATEGKFDFAPWNTQETRLLHFFPPSSPPYLEFGPLFTVQAQAFISTLQAALRTLLETTHRTSLSISHDLVTAHT